MSAKRYTNTHLHTYKHVVHNSLLISHGSEPMAATGKDSCVNLIWLSINNYSNISSILVVNGQWLMAHFSWLMAAGRKDSCMSLS